MQRSWWAAVVCGALVGCQAERPGFLASAHNEVTDRLADPFFTARLQKPDGEKGVAPVSFLDRTPVRSEDLAEGDRRAAAIWATVNGKPILEDEVRESCHHFLIELQKAPEPIRSVRVKEVLLRERDRLIEQELLLQDAYSRLSKAGKQYMDKLKEAAGKQFDRQLRLYKTHYNVKSDAELKKLLSNQGMSLEGIRRQKEREFIATEYLRSRIMPAIEDVTPSQMIEYFRAHPDEFTALDRVEWQDIFIASSEHPTPEAARKHAETIANRVRAGEDFAKLAEQYDNGYTRRTGGVGVGQQRGQIGPPELEPYVFQLREGEVGSVIEVPAGFHVIRVVKREYAGVRPFDEKVQSEIRNKLRNEIFSGETKRILADLRRQGTIEVSSTVP